MVKMRAVGLVLVVALVLSSSIGLVVAQGVALGPRDGSGLPPTDIERVAVGKGAPDFTLEAKDGAPVTISSFRGKKDVVLVFYRGHW